MTYDIDLIEMACDECALPCSKVSDAELHVSIAPGVVMVVANTEDNDTYWGFTDVAWHTHDELSLSHGEPGYVNYMPEEMIVAWSKGTILLVSLIKDGDVVDRWFAHRGDASDLEQIELGESLHYTTASNKALNRTPSAPVSLNVGQAGGRACLPRRTPPDGS